jgi:hypothetical protein
MAKSINGQKWWKLAKLQGQEEDGHGQTMLGPNIDLLENPSFNPKFHFFFNNYWMCIPQLEIFITESISIATAK